MHSLHQCISEVRSKKMILPAKPQASNEGRYRMSRTAPEAAKLPAASPFIQPLHHRMFAPWHQRMSRTLSSRQATSCHACPCGPHCLKMIDATQQQAKGITVSNMVQHLLQETQSMDNVKPISCSSPKAYIHISSASTLALPRWML